MDSKKLGQKPAFGIPKSSTNGFINAGSKGISQRLYVATKAMQGLISNPDWEQGLQNSNVGATEGIELTCKAAYLYADELLKQEDK